VQVKCKGSMTSWRFLTNITLYFENGTKYGHSYNGRQIGTRMRSRLVPFTPSMTPNLDFKVTIF